MNLNKVLMMGNLTRDPQAKALPSGMQLCEMGIALSRRYKTASGEEREEVCFVDMTAFAGTADYCMRTLTKGSPVYVEGTLRMDSWVDKDTGKNRTRLKVNVDTIVSLVRQPANPNGMPSYPQPGQPPMGAGYGQPAYPPQGGYNYPQAPGYPPPPSFQPSYGGAAPAPFAAPGATQPPPPQPAAPQPPQPPQSFQQPPAPPLPPQEEAPAAAEEVADDLPF